MYLSHFIEALETLQRVIVVVHVEEGTSDMNVLELVSKRALGQPPRQR